MVTTCRRVPVRNKSNRTLRLMIKPIAQAFDIAAGTEVMVSSDVPFNVFGIEVEVWDDNFISLWITAETSVCLDGNRLDPLKEA